MTKKIIYVLELLLVKNTLENISFLMTLLRELVRLVSRKSMRTILFIKMIIFYVFNHLKSTKLFVIMHSGSFFPIRSDFE